MRAWRALLRGIALLPRELEADLQAAHGLSLGAYGVLVRLSETPERALRMGQLADEVGLTRSAMTRLIDRLVQDGYVERVSCPSDARGSFARLTEAGLAALQGAYPTHLASARRWVFDRLDEQQVSRLAELMCTLAGDSPAL